VAHLAAGRAGHVAEAIAGAIEPLGLTLEEILPSGTVRRIGHSRSLGGRCQPFDRRVGTELTTLGLEGQYSTNWLYNQQGEQMQIDPLSATFAALADPTRRAILARLAQGDATVNELAQPFPVSIQAVSKHLKVLERAGLVTRGRAAQQRPA